jgi:hypothetical protein
LHTGSECWPLLKKDGNTLGIFVGKTLRTIHGPIVGNGIWRTRYNNELYTLYDELDVVKVIKMGTFRWLGQLFTMQELKLGRKLTVLNAEGTRRVGEVD